MVSYIKYNFIGEFICPIGHLIVISGKMPIALILYHQLLNKFHLEYSEEYVYESFLL